MGFQEFGKLPGVLRERQFVSFDRIRSGTITAQELVIAGGANGKIMSQNFEPGVDGWAIFSDGSAQFWGDVTLGEDAIITGDVYSANWNGATPANLASRDGAASAGFYFDSSVGSAQLEGDVWLGELATLEFGLGGLLKMAPAGAAGLEISGSTLVLRSAAGVVQGRVQDDPPAGVTVRVGVGSDNVPTLTFEGDPDLGFFRVSANVLGVTAAGAEVARFAAVGLTMGGSAGTGSAFISGDVGTASLPAYSFNGDTNTGMYRSGAGIISFATEGVERFELNGNTSGTFGTNGSNLNAGFTEVVGACLNITGIIYSGRAGVAAFFGRTDTPTGGAVLDFRRAGVQVGTIALSAGATAYNTSSDERLKQEIREADPSKLLEAVKTLMVQEYNFIDDSLRQHGLLAQELQKIYPEAVTAPTEDGSVEHWQIDYGRLTPLLLGAIKELDRRLDNLEIGVVTSPSWTGETSSKGRSGPPLPQRSRLFRSRK